MYVCMYVYVINCYQSLDEEAMADVTLLREGRHPPGKIYSFINPELLLCSSYLSSGIELNCIVM